MLLPPPPRYSREETARRGHEIYLHDILPAVAETHRGQYAVIDIETGAYELDRDDYTAAQRLLTREPNAQMWLEQVGFSAARRMVGLHCIMKDVAA